MRRICPSIVAAMALGATVIASSSAPIAAQDAPRVFTRTGQWQLDAGAEECRLARVFTNGTDQIALALERNSADSFVRLTLVGDAIRPYRTAETVGYRFLPEGEQRTAGYLKSETPDGQAYFNFGAVALRAPMAPGTPTAPMPVAEGVLMPFALVPYDRAAEQAFAAGVTGIEFNDGLTAAIRLDTGSLRGAIQALQACADDLLRTWGLDWERHQTLTRRAAPIGEAREWVPRGTFGFDDMGLLSGARNQFRVMIDAQGRPTACHTHRASLSAAQNEQICNLLMQNGNFAPALDAQGQALASYWMAAPFELMQIMVMPGRRR